MTHQHADILRKNQTAVAMTATILNLVLFQVENAHCIKRVSHVRAVMYVQIFAVK